MNDTTSLTLSDTYVLDAQGRRLRHTNAAGWSDTTDYDSLGRVTSTVSAQGLTTGYAYVLSSSNVGLAGQTSPGWTLTTTSADGYTTVDQTDYFGHTTAHRDRAKRQFTYNYDLAGHLSGQTSKLATANAVLQNISYTYFDNGNIRQITDMVAHTRESYGYDNAGDRVYESRGWLSDDNQQVVGLTQDDTITYDELGRMARVGASPLAPGRLN